MTTTVIMSIYTLLSGLVACLLLREFMRTKNLQDALLLCIILIPFILRTIHIK